MLAECAGRRASGSSTVDVSGLSISLSGIACTAESSSSGPSSVCFFVAHARRFFPVGAARWARWSWVGAISEVGTAVIAASSAARAAATRLTPSLLPWICVVQLDDRVEQHLGPRRAAGQVDVDRDDVVDALDDRVVVEHAAGAGAHAHRDDPLGVGHLVVDLAHDRGHLLRHPAGDDHQVGLARRGGEPLHAEPGDVVVGGADGHHLDRAAGEAEGGRPDRGLAHVADDVLERRQDEPCGQLLLESHQPSLVCAAGAQAHGWCAPGIRVVVVVSPTPDPRASTRRRRRRTR